MHGPMNVKYNKNNLPRTASPTEKFSFVFRVMYITSQQGLILGFTPATAVKTKPILVYLERRVLSSGPSPHRSNVANLGLLLTIPDERSKIFGHEVHFFLQHSNSERQRGNGHKDRLTFVHYMPAVTYFIIEI
jgi:hypothetical protein